MTLGLATCDDSGIYMAIESEGLPYPGLPKKILELNNEPQVIVLAAGGLEHWAYVLKNYINKSTVNDATLEIVRLLDSCMTTGKNKAFGLVCGYQNDSPRCYRLNREVNDSYTSVVEEDLSNIQPLGIYTEEAIRIATQAIEGDMNQIKALYEGINSLFPREKIKPPIEHYIILAEKSSSQKANK